MRIPSTALLVLAALTPSAFSAPGKIRFDRDIQPILSENCFACHGPDKHERKAKLRLDIPDGGALENRDGVTGIVPGKPEESELIARLTIDDEDELMPPPKSEKKLSAKQIALLTQWVKEGAEWADHWSYRKPEKAEVPADTHPVDHFVRQRLAADNVKPSPTAAPATLIRRLTFDLTGMPPTREEVAAFESQAASDLPAAIGSATDRLLDSPRYGERMAAFWLDLVRYADSIGYHSDAPMSVYYYREWVINAFNQNQPFDTFTRWQIAGDLLPNATIEQKIASGYNRLLQTTEEGGAQAKEYKAIYAADRVRNISGAWLGGTLGCAQCHDHKYDPYTAKDFYSMAAFFADIDEVAVGRRKPGLPIVSDEHKKRVAELTAQIDQLSKAATQSSPELVTAQTEWEAAMSKSAHPTLSEWHQIGPFTGGNAFKKAYGPEKKIDLKASIGDKKWSAKPKYKDGTVHALPGGDNTAWYLTRTITVPTAGPLALSFGSDDGIKVWINGEEKVKNKAQRAAAPDQEKVTVDLKKGANTLLVKIFNSGGNAGFYFNAKGHGLPAEITSILAVAPDQRDAGQKRALSDHYLKSAPLLADARSKRDAAIKQKADLEKNLPRQLVTVTTKPREMRVLPRGNWLDDTGEVVQPAIPAFLGKIETGSARATRLDLAEWIVDPDNPLTARAFVNRVWKLFYGAGISRNVDDLGAQGQWPSHPELLDGLTVDFVESGWDVKRLVRRLVTSETYAQSSRSSEADRDRDPLNVLLARQARFRLDAEMVRDNALALGGILEEKIGGRSAKPYQPAGYWRHLNFPQRKYQHDADKNQYRRAVYTHWQRSFLHPSLLAFDAPSREECTAERPRSNTPLQALVLLNDPTYVEAARGFAERIVENGGATPEERIGWAMKEALARPAKKAELEVLGQLQTVQLARYYADNPSADEALTVGLLPKRTDAPAAELASWIAVARTIMNLHETIARQ